MATQAHPAPSPAPPIANLDWLPDHTGRRRDPALDMFAPPPPEIGQPISGSSSLSAGKTGWPIGLRLVVCAMIIGVGVVPAAMVGGTAGLVFVGVAALVALAQWKRTAFIHFVDYIGREGIAQIELTGGRTGTPNKIVTRWAEVEAVHTAQVDHIRNNVYMHTEFAYGWWDAAKKLKFAIAGQYHRDAIPPNQRIHFARAAEHSWNQFYLPFLYGQLQRDGAIAFRLGADQARAVRVGAGFLEFHGFETQPIRVTKPEIASFSLAGGEFSFKHVDARWYSGAGKFKFHYGSMPNAQLFLMVLEQLMGFRV